MKLKFVALGNKPDVNNILLNAFFGDNTLHFKHNLELKHTAPYICGAINNPKFFYYY